MRKVLIPSTQTSIRIHDELLAWVDAQIAAGQVGSRSEMFIRALERERRRVQTVRDVRSLIATPVTDVDSIPPEDS